MTPPETFSVRAARWLTFGSAVSILFSIAACQILLALALAALLFSGIPLRLPRIKLPLALFLLGTLISLAFSGDMAAGLPQVRKFYVFLELLVVFSCLRDMKMIRWVFLTWAGFGSIDALRGLVQFVEKVQQARAAHAGDYAFYVGERITGFSSHWNTFSAQMMFAILMLAAFLFFAPEYRKRMWVWIVCAGLMSLAVLLAETRAVWIALSCSSVYLIWFWRRWLVAVVPVAIVLIYLVSPPVIHERFSSFLHPKGVDSNSFRIVTWTTGLRMIEAHPLLGLGPEEPRIHFDEYMPKELLPKPEGSYIHLHNVYLEYAAERGIPTMLIMMWLLLQTVYDFWRRLRVLPPGRSNARFLLHGGIAVVLATMVEGVAEYNLGITGVLTMFLVVVACGYLALEKDVVAV
ncbi:MAG TPA: O-antigen ligase family protein [Bryobacteraceae bacterium]